MPLSYPEPPLTDDVVILRPWELKDLPVLEEASCDEYVSLVEQLPVPFDARRGQDWIARKHATLSGGDGCELAIAERESGDAIGGIGFVFRHVPGTAEAGYWIVERRRRQGFASRALEIFSRWALTSGGGVVRMQATVEPWNLASQRVLAKAGFLQEGRLRSYASWRGRREDVFMYSLLAEDLELTGVAGSRVTRTRPSSVDLGAAWEENASAFIAWARTPNHDSYWQFHRDVFLELLPPRGRRTLDLGCGEGRLSRDLKRLGHDVVGIDGSPTMVAAARDADAEIEVQLADAAALPFADGEFDLVVAFMSLQDIDDFAGAVRESARVLEAGGRLCLAIVHPLNSAGRFEGATADSVFTIAGSYLDHSYYADNVVRDGLEIDFVSAHRPLQDYTEALANAGLLIERLREPALPEYAITREHSRRWQRLPVFLHARALKP